MFQQFKETYNNKLFVTSCCCWLLQIIKSLHFAELPLVHKTIHSSFSFMFHKIELPVFTF